MTGVTFVVPVLNGAPWIARSVAAILAQDAGQTLQILVVDDGSRDGSVEALGPYIERGLIQLVAGPCRGAAAALNAGLRLAQHPIVCQVDQDVILDPAWLRHMLVDFEDSRVGAVQGRYVLDRSQPLASRVMACDLTDRYRRLAGGRTNHVCTGNAAYRADALRAIGGFDEALGYGYDNDVSYRLARAGYHLRFSPAAESVHYWRAGLSGYARQQFGFGYGRLEVVRKHPARVAGDRVSPASMMLHPVLTLAAGVLLAGAVGAAAVSAPWHPPVALSLAILGALAVERAAAGIRASRACRAWEPLLFPCVHFVRDVVWAWAMVIWAARFITARPRQPRHSMSPRRPSAQPPALRLSKAVSIPDAAVLAVIPAYNEADALPRVINDLRRCCPGMAVLVVDDGSTDGTASVAAALGVRWLRLSERLGVGGAMRAGLRYAAHHRFSAVVRLDGDGQHAAEDVARVLGPIRGGTADVVLGSRFAAGDGAGSCPPRWPRRLLGACLARLAGRPVTDPTSGFWALGPRAVRLLAEHHPTGYPEPELLLFLGRNGLSSVEVRVRSQPRAAGRTSLTWGRTVTAAVRVLLAMLIVPLRHSAGVDGD
jgi:glycosyltransferase involved in cell wall biosynthesis